MSKIVGFTCGAFDLCHPGHTQMFEYCKKHCDVLIVGLQVDPTLDRPTKQKPIESLHHRALRLYQCKSVDFVIPYDTEANLFDLLLLLNIDIRFLDEAYENKDFTGLNIATDFKQHKIHYTPRKHSASSSNLRNEISGCK